MAAIVTMALAATTAGSAAAPKPNFCIDSIELKPEGRFDGEIMAECDVPKLLRESVDKLAKERSRARSKKAVPPDPIALRLRIDKVVRIGAGQAGMGSYPGNEIGVTAFAVADTEIHQYFLCRGNFGGLALRLSACSRVEHCADEIAEHVSDWVASGGAGGKNPAP